MPGLIVWKNQQVDRLRKDMDQIFDRLCGEFGLSGFPKSVQAFPRIDLNESGEGFIINAKIPGLDPNDIHIDITENSLSLKGKIEKDKIRNGEGFVLTEQQSSTFSRKFHLPCRIVVDEVKATYRDGVLTVVLPKLKQQKTKKVKIEF